jgi:hypothetical protein
MHVVVHQAPRQNIDIPFRRSNVQKIEVPPAVGIALEYGLAIVSALGHMVGASGHDNAGGSGHCFLLSPTCLSSEEAN